MSDMPQEPWQKVHADFYGPLPSGEYLLVVIDRYSRYPEIVRSTKSSSVIPKFDKIFATHGIPVSMTTDNGPPFNGDEYSRYLKLWVSTKILQLQNGHKEMPKSKDLINRWDML